MREAYTLLKEKYGNIADSKSLGQALARRFQFSFCGAQRDCLLGSAELRHSVAVVQHNTSAF